ncbi:MAG: ribbon-helix-helix protein, CopG family [Rhodospirillaceae bacterium]
MTSTPVTTTVNISISEDLNSRLAALAERMEKSKEEILVLALQEYAENWEDHLDTVDVLKEGDDRVQLVVNES